MLYLVRVEGQLDYSWSDWLGGLSITAQPDGSTLLTGTLPDQAALHGVLNKLYSLNLPLLSVQCIRLEREDGQDSK